MELLLYPVTEVFIIALINSMSSHIFLQWLRLIFGAYVLETNKHEMDTAFSKRDRS